MEVFPLLKTKRCNLNEKYYPYCTRSSKTKSILPVNSITTPKRQDSEPQLMLKKYASNLFILPLPSNSTSIRIKQKFPSSNNKLLKSRLTSHRNSEQSIKSEFNLQTEKKTLGFSEIMLSSQVFQTPFKVERKGFQGSGHKLRMQEFNKSGGISKKWARYIDCTVPQSISIVSKTHRNEYFD